MWFVAYSPFPGPPGANEKPLPGSYFLRSPNVLLIRTFYNYFEIVL